MSFREITFLLFIVVLDYVLRISVDSFNKNGVKAPQGTRDSGLFLSDLNFANDLALISESIQNIENYSTVASQVSLYCNELKTEFISSSDKAPPLIS